MRLTLKWLVLLGSVASSVVFLTACGSEAAGGQSYKDNKAMILEILKSDDGKKAIAAAINGDEESESSGGQGGDSGGDKGNSGGGGDSGNKGKMKTLNTSDTKELKMVVQEVLTNQDNSKFLQSMMKDPKFAGDFAKAIKKEDKKLHMELLKDPEYQKDLLTIMQNQEFETILMNTLKSIKSRQQMKLIVQDTMQNPLFKAELVTLLKKAVEEHLKEPEKKKQDQGQGQGGGDGGGGGGGGGGQGNDQGGEQDGGGDGGGGS